MMKAGMVSPIGTEPLMMTALSSLKTILIADDHNLFRHGLKLVLKEIVGGVGILEAGDFEAARDAIANRGPVDLILLDLSMPGMDVENELKALCESVQPVPVVMLSAYHDKETVRKSIDAGARGYLLKSFTEESLRFALGLILSGEVYVPSSVLSGSNGMDVLPPKRARASGGGSGPNPLAALTKRQHDVLMLIMQGQSNKTIARTLGVYESTVKAHIQVILQKLKADNRTHAAMIAREWTSPAGADAVSGANA